MSKHPNPWALTEREVGVLNALSELGCQKLAAKRLAISVPTVNCHLRSAKNKAGERFTTPLLVRWALIKLDPSFDRRVSLEGAPALWSLMRLAASC